MAAALTGVIAMVTKLLCSGVGAFLLAAIVSDAGAQASEAMTVADRAGFLVGHAQRCGIAEDRLERSAKRMDAIITAFAADDADRDAAQARFAQTIAAAALAQLLGDKLPSCAVVRSTLAQFERHRDPVTQPEGQMAREEHRNGGTIRRAASAAATQGKAAKVTAPRRAELSTERRAARESRG